MFSHIGRVDIVEITPDGGLQTTAARLEAFGWKKDVKVVFPLRDRHFVESQMHPH